MSSHQSPKSADPRTQRAKRACEPCRKRKAKCSGEQPTCSTCERLNHSCSYRPRHDQFREYRAKNALRHQVARSPAPAADYTEPSPVVQQALRPYLRTPQPVVDPDDCPLPAYDVLSSVWEAYFTRVNMQPVPLLEPMTLESFNLTSTPSELVHGVLAVAIRHSTHPFFGDAHIEFGRAHNNSARHIIYRTLEESGNIGLPTIQAMCLISLADYLDGLGRRASLTLGTCIRLAYSLNLLKSGGLENMSEKEDVVRCCWSLFALERLFSIAAGNCAPLIDDNDLPRYPASAFAPPHAKENTEPHVSIPEAPLDLGIMAYCLQLTPTWSQVLQYAMRHKNQNAPELPWMADSEYNRINARILHFEAVCPDEHRWWRVDFVNQTGEDVERLLEYWAPWLLKQCLFHSCLALLNHPLLFLRAPPAYSNVPLSFTKSTSGQAQLHTNWIAHFADLIKKKNIRVTNPFVAFSAAIACTIQIFHSRVKDECISNRARQNFLLCSGLVKEIGKSMPIIAELSRKLDTLNLDGDVPIHSDLLWRIIEYGSTSSSPEGDLSFKKDWITTDSIQVTETGSVVHFLEEDTAVTVQPNLASDTFISVDFGQYSFPVFDSSVLDDMTFGDL